MDNSVFQTAKSQFQFFRTHEGAKDWFHICNILHGQVSHTVDWQHFIAPAVPHKIAHMIF